MPTKLPETWEIYDESMPFAGAIYSRQRVRMTVIGLGEERLLVVSPGNPMSEERFEQISKWGKKLFLLAPNSYHNAGLAPWKERFSDATVIAHPRAHARLTKKVPGVSIGDLSLLDAALPEGIRLLSPPMAKQGETWVSVTTKDGVAWVVTDGMLNEERLPGGALGLFLRLVGFRTGLMTNPFFKRLFLTSKSEYKEWALAELDRDKPVMFVPAHGAVLRGPDVHERLRAATDAA